MAYTKVFAIRARLDDRVKYAINGDKTELDEKINYAADLQKTNSVRFVSALNCKSAETAFAAMRRTKEKFCKTDGVLGYHFIQSFAPGEVTPEQAHEIGCEFAWRLFGEDFEDRQALRDRIDRRVDIMVEQGLLAEAEALLSGGLPRDATALQAIGYKQFLAVAEGTATAEEAIEEVKLRSRQYAKRQLTWLRRNPDIFWVRWQRDPNFPEGLQKATEYLHSRGLC